MVSCAFVQLHGLRFSSECNDHDLLALWVRGRELLEIVHCDYVLPVSKNCVRLAAGLCENRRMKL